MFPSLSQQHGVDSSNTEPKLARQRRLRDTTSRVALTHLCNDVFRQLGVPVPATSWHSFRFGGLPVGLAACLSALLNLVGNIVSLRSKKQMLWVNASRHVAPVKHKLIGWNRPIHQQPRTTVCVPCPPTELKVPISTTNPVFVGLLQATRPQPASIGFVDLSPEVLRFSSSKHLHQYKDGHSRPQQIK